MRTALSTVIATAILSTACAPKNGLRVDRSQLLDADDPAKQGAMVAEAVGGAEAAAGRWYLVPQPPRDLQMQAIHLALLPNGKVLIVNGSSNRDNANPKAYMFVDNAAVFDPDLPDGHGMTKVPATPRPGVDGQDIDLFCSGHIHLLDGRVMFVGGTRQYADNFRGARLAWAFDWRRNQWDDLGKLIDGRWYPTLAALADGKIAVFSGLVHDARDRMSRRVEIFDPRTQKWSATEPFDNQPNNPFAVWPAGWDFYPRIFLGKDGRLLMTGDGSGYGDRRARGTIFAQLDANAMPPTIRFERGPDRPDLNKFYPSAVYDPTSFDGDVLIFSGQVDNNMLEFTGSPGEPGFVTNEVVRWRAATNTFEIVHNVLGENPVGSRLNHQAVLLPTKEILVVGGGNFGYTQPVTTPILLTPDAGSPGGFRSTPMAPHRLPRLYHTSALLLPDGRVLLAGGNVNRGKWIADDDGKLELDLATPGGIAAEQHQLELFEPPYLFLPGPRPRITRVAPVVHHDETFEVAVDNLTEGSQLILMRAGSMTHAMDVDQRAIPLQATLDLARGVAAVRAPHNRNVAYPGYYMLFVVNAQGKPSVAAWVQLLPPEAASAP